MKKRFLSWLLVGNLALSLLPGTAFAAELPPDGSTVKGTLVTERNNGDMNRIPYNNPDAIVDVDAGTWASPAVMDVNGDGYLDLVVIGTAVCYSGTHVFYGGPDSAEDLTMSKGYKVADGVGNAYPTYLYSEEGNYEDTLMFSGSSMYPDFKDTFWSSGQNLNVNITWPQDSTRANEYSLVDYDGDGLLDLIRGAENWNEYGWAGKFDSTGHWGDENSDPLHGWVMWAKNRGTNDNPDFSGSAQLVCIDNDPENPIDTYGHPAPSFYDWDGDGALDLMCGNFVDDILYFENIGTRTQPRYKAGVAPKLENGKNLQMELCMLTTTSFDWNGDGLMDLIVGEEDGRVCYMKNTGEFAANGAPIFKEPAYFKMPADSLKDGILSTPFSIDWDGDGDEDLFSGDSAGYFNFIENITPEDGDLTDPMWAPPVRLTDENGKVIRIMAGPNGSIQGPAEEKWGYTVLSMGDWNGDGKVDIVANSIWGKIVWLENIGETGRERVPRFAAPQPVRVDDAAPDKPSWNWWDPEPYELVSQWRSMPFVIDLNEDGLVDLVMLDSEGYLAFYEKQENGMVKPGERIFLNQSNGALRLSSGTQGSSGRLNFTMVDWDGDGKLDIVRNDGTSVSWLRNIGEEDTPWKFANEVNLHPRKITSHTPCPTVCDWNKDGVPDLIVGAEDGHFYYFVNKTAQYVEPEPPRTNLDDYLVAHWDFEGTDQATQLKDKATAGTSTDDLTIEGTNVIISDSVAVLGPEAGNVLNAGNLADVSQAGPMTIFMKVKVSAGKTTDYIGLADKRIFNQTDRSYAVVIPSGTENHTPYFWFSSDGSGTSTKVAQTDPASQGLTADRWRELAVVAEKDASTGNINIKMYLSKGESTVSGSDFSLVAYKSTSYSGICATSTAPLLLGRDANKRAAGVTISYDDVRIYNDALSAEELATILEGTPNVEVKADQLRSLSLDGVSFAPLFAPSATSYSAVVGSDADRVTVRANAKDSSTVTVNGMEMSGDGVAVTLQDGENPVVIKVINKADPTVFTTYTLTITKQAASEMDPEEHLVARWDFEGDTEEEQLRDKAPAGDVEDHLIMDGDIRIENGAAVYDRNKKSVLISPSSKDLEIAGELTLVAKVRMSVKQGVVGIVDRRYFGGVRAYGMFTADLGGTSGYYGIGGEAAGQTVRDGDMEVAQLNEWATLVTVISRGSDNNLVLNQYVSNKETPAGSTDFLSARASKALGKASLDVSTTQLYIGNNKDMQAMNGKMEICEVRIYDTALTLDQLAALDMPVPKISAAALETLMASAPADEKHYTAYSWERLQDALEAAQAALDSGDHHLIDAAYGALDSAINNLKKYYVATGDLAELLDTVPEDGYKYTEDSWNALMAAVEAAEEILEDNISPLPSPAEILAAYDALDAALNNLVLQTYTLTFETNGGSAIASKEDLKGAVISLTAIVPERDGYDFVGWYSDEGLTYAVDSVTLDKNVTIYAKWKASGDGYSGGPSAPRSYTLHFSTNGGSDIGSVAKVSGTEIELSKYVPFKSGYEFAGWYSDAGLTRAVTSVKLTATTTIYAKWTKAAAPFTDVVDGSYYADAVDWAVENGVTSGTSATTFSPDAACTRGQVVTFLWRAMGSPEPVGTADPFTDVDSGSYYDKAVLWAVENGITSGTGAATFSPDATVTRGQVVTFLWRSAGAEKADSANPFTDVAADSYCADAVIWAAENGITNGVTSSAFAPDQGCSRGQIVTLLWRYLGK